MTGDARVGFARTVALLLAAARRRSAGRRRRQRELLDQRRGREGIDWGGFGALIGALFMAIIHGTAAWALISAVESGQRLRLEQAGKIVVSDNFYEWVQENDGADWNASDDVADYLNDSYRAEADRIVEDEGGDRPAIQARLKASIERSASRDLVPEHEAEGGLANLAASGRAAAILGSCVLLWWFAMMACQGEGLELDIQRRRHPMWEWLMSHPVGAGAVFMAEMLSPIAANPSYWSAPLFVGILYGVEAGLGIGVAAALMIGVPLAVASACVGKALEIGAILRLAPRNRGAVIGVMSWFGYASMLGLFFGAAVMPWLGHLAGRWVDAAGPSHWSLLGLFLGQDANGGFSLLRGVAFGWAASALLIAAAVTFSAQSMRRGLAGAFASDTLRRERGSKAKFGREPLFRKEYLWFTRDRSAIVQTVLIPVTVASFQLFNLRGLLRDATNSWNLLSGAAIFFGTYFLWILGPKSLTSEGAALWIALTWPRGLESILKAKAWLWSMIATAMVFAVLLFGCVMFPSQMWKIGIVAVAWYFFARSMAEKSVTLITVVSESGEAQKIPSGRRWAAQLGMLTFAIGVCTQQWNLAVVGVVYSWITAAAMWENLRARLPYLFDPWSEELPKPPTLMHAMVAISILVECASILTAGVYAFVGDAGLAVAQGLGYAVCAVAVSIGVAHFLDAREVTFEQIWTWRENRLTEARSWFSRFVASDAADARWLSVGFGGGIALAFLAQFYLAGARFIPGVGEMIDASRHQMNSIPGLNVTYAIIAIGFAPFAEEYLFRGLLYRTLDEQWGGTKAVLGAASFFAIYHPPLSWLPVALVGMANCLLFRQSRSLAPPILLHMTYNAVVIWLT